MTNINEIDLRKFFASYWLLHSAIYNFAQGLSNQRNRRFTWAITNYYYSLVFIGRLFMFLAKDLYYKGHSDIAKFFMGKNVGGEALKLKESGEFEKISNACGNPNSQDRSRSTKNQDIYIYLSEIANRLNFKDEEIKKFGEIIKQLKDFRNSNTYEAFIIYAQENHPILTEFMVSATDKVREITEYYLKTACKVFFNFWRGKSEQFIHLLNHKWVIPATLEMLKLHSLPTEDLKVIINRGFYFENEEIYQEDLIKIREMMEQKPKTGLKREFEKTCSITSFGAKRRLIDEVFSIFKKLIKINQ